MSLFRLVGVVAAGQYQLKGARDHPHSVVSCRAADHFGAPTRGDAESSLDGLGLIFFIVLVDEQQASPRAQHGVSLAPPSCPPPRATRVEAAHSECYSIW